MVKGDMQISRHANFTFQKWYLITFVHVACYCLFTFCGAASLQPVLKEEFRRVMVMYFEVKGGVI